MNQAKYKLLNYMETEVSRVIMVSKTYEKALETAIEKAL